MHYHNLGNQFDHWSCLNENMFDFIYLLMEKCISCWIREGVFSSIVKRFKAFLFTKIHFVNSKIRCN